MDEFQKEQNQLVQHLLDKYLLKYWKKENIAPAQATHGLELFITPVCNQKCSYCYLVKNGDKLYPKEIRDKETILNNLRILFKYLIENEVTLPRLDLFSGEIWGMEFGNQVFDEILNALDTGLDIYTVMIPTNSSYVADDKVVEVMKYYTNEFDKRGTKLKLSASVDGALVEEENRPYKLEGMTQKIKTSEFYDKLCRLYFDMEWGFHPMIDASTIEKQKDNYVWWHNQFAKFNHDNPTDWGSFIMTLEVRNDSWTDDKIFKYLDWLNFCVDYDFEHYWSEFPDEFLFDMLLGMRNSAIPLKNGKLKRKRNVLTNKSASFSYVPYTTYLNESPKFGCTAGTYICVRLGDLSLMPCHRTAYPKLLYGKFNVENNEITGVTANNPFLMFNILGQGHSTMFKCDTCPVSGYCMKGCLGSQLESMNDLFYPIQSVCNFYMARAIFMYYKIHDFIDKQKLNETLQLNTLSIDLIFNRIKDERSDEVQKWTEIISPLMK